MPLTLLHSTITFAQLLAPGEALGGLKGVTDAKVTREQELLAGIERRIEAMAEELANIGRANAKHTSKTAAILERMELDGIDIREVENA